MAALLAAAVVSSSVGLGPANVATAQTFEESPQIKQVVGKELSSKRRYGSSNYSNAGGLLGSLFGGSSNSSSSKSSEPYRRATPTPTERDVDWSGIPYHTPNGEHTASKSAAPIRDPGTASRQLAQPSRSSSTSGTRSAIPTPPPIAQTTPRRLSTPSPEPAATSSRRPAPLSVSSSSRRPVSLDSTASQPTRIESKEPALVKKSTPRVIKNSDTTDSVELVPRVSRKVVKSTAPAKTTPAKTEPPKAVAEPTKVAAVPTKKAVVKSEQPSSRRVATEVTSKPEPAKTETPRIAAAPVRKPAPKPAPAPEKPAPAPAPRQVATAPAPAPAPAKPETNVSSITLGAARQAEIASTNTPSTTRPAPAPQPTAVNNQAVSSRQQAPADAGTVAANSAGSKPANQFNRMTTFGNNQDGGRSAGSLAGVGNSDVALHPISDRLPIENQHATPDPMKAQHDSQFTSHEDAFAPRSRTAAGPTAPNYHTAGYGQGTGYGQTPVYGQSTGYGQQAPSSPAATQHPNAMRDQHGTAAAAIATPKTPAINVAANSNMTATELPVIRILTAGPRRVMIRQTHPYEIRVENRGSVDAEGLVVRAHIPDWGDVVGHQVTRGDVQSATEEQVRNLNWRIEKLGAGESETMYVRLKAARPGTHDLDVDWTLAPQKKIVQVIVQEPQLALTIDGPDEVIYGQSKTYQIRVLNPGDGIAPEVVFTLSPESSSPQSQRIGDIPAGKEAQFEVELTAQDLGELKIHGLAVGDLDLRAEAGKNVRVLAADLEAILSGPEVKYQGSNATYQLELTNHGTTASEDVIANLQLPMGVVYQGGMEGATMIDNQLRWKIASLTPGAVRKYQFQCRMESTGTHQFAFDCKGSAAGQTNVSLDTNVEAIADLVLSVVDPSAPAPIGEDVSYQIVIRNRGSKPAHNVQAVAQFSHGIEPKQISGHVGKVITGQVLIDPIPRIDAGEEVKMTIVAQAETGGHHRFRTEVRSGDTVLVAEEATHYLAPKNDRITRRSGPGGNEFSLPLR
ncbi:COG1361 family protein [Rhodopirellula sallentina]|uniref:Cysteine-rich periplasmic protein omcB n=1 Tax=Rhodopirellula sallentina SM41 TaxID=1263870 RepID=M5UE77_9BACT|nr:DUF11 domain-containing protein [Rhodopirellula sallentina]EMI54303.1 cysteine-rich periplasmic protein omcB [Rhodopirellula sallentina SM41]